MNILWIYNMPLDPEAGGTERITSLVSKGLSNLGHNCMGMLVFDQHSGTMTYDGARVDNLYEFLKERHVDVVINQIAYAKWLLNDFLTKGGARWRKEGGKIISCLHFDPKPTSDLYYFRCQRNKTIRDRINLAKAWLLFRYYEKRQDRMKGEVLNWIYDNSDVYVALSQTHFPYFKKVTRREEYNKLKAINNPLTFDSIADESVLREKKKVVLVCSRMDEYHKRVSLSLKAWRAIMDKPEAEGWALKILGTGPDLDMYKKYAAKHKLRDVYFMGRRSPEAFYRESDMFLMTSPLEGWGLTLTESLQCGVVPVVMNTCSVYSDIIDHGYNGFLSEGSDLKVFSNYMLSLMADGPLRQSMQRNALDSAQKFTLDITMQKWQGILNEINV